MRGCKLRTLVLAKGQTGLVNVIFIASPFLVVFIRLSGSTASAAIPTLCLPSQREYLKYFSFCILVRNSVFQSILSAIIKRIHQRRLDGFLPSTQIVATKHCKPSGDSRARKTCRVNDNEKPTRTIFFADIILTADHIS